MNMKMEYRLTCRNTVILHNVYAVTSKNIFHFFCNLFGKNKCLGIHIFRYFKKIGEMILRQNQSVSFRRRSQIQNHTKIFIFIQRS